MILKRLFTVAITLAGILIAAAQPKEKLLLTKQEAESLFLHQNLELLASRLEISQAEAQLLQSKFWPNPTFSISDVNLWKNSTVEEQPPIINEWGKTTQFSLEIEQIIQTAGKRRKNLALKNLTVKEKEYEFEIVLRQLKLDLRNTLTKLQFQNAIQILYKEQIVSTDKLIQAYQSQLKQGNISQAEYIRLKAAAMLFKKELTEATKEYESASANLKTLLGLSSNYDIEITESLEIPKTKVSEIEIENLTHQANESLPEILLAKNFGLQADKQLAIEKADCVPDLAFSVSYDRAGNIMQNFVGVGLSFDLPVFNRNKGAIKEAQLEIEKQAFEYENKIIQNSNDIQEAFNHYKQSLELYTSIEPDYEATLDLLISSYHQNFINKNVSLISYLDFVDAYLENKTLILETQKDLIDNFELLKFTTGKEL
ncbi:TolC family protein [Myroides guanonis]|uniref:Outer membrane protein, cobalt-zinc-cadmium efflux system n=1 Tax=Myroides guanonis TaxID=1150112 RepID=A0A1I3SNN6_9FLAO|nr:TolC family protein [Myroides guanonis]SFJ60143.1 outer membrane protein, cobalt-zinc-cadmium efflux system [Myroides guanonis]